MDAKESLLGKRKRTCNPIPSPRKKLKTSPDGLFFKLFEKKEKVNWPKQSRSIIVIGNKENIKKLLEESSAVVYYKENKTWIRSRNPIRSQQLKCYSEIFFLKDSSKRKRPEVQAYLSTYKMFGDDLFEALFEEKEEGKRP